MNRAEALQIQTMGREIGYPIAVDGDFGPKSKSMIWSFQRAFNPYRSKADPSKVFGAGVAHLRADGDPGDLTKAAMRLSADNGGRLSLHFTYPEFACGHKACTYCGGWLEVPNAVLTACELARERLFAPHGMGFVVQGGSRCYSRNRYVIKGASNSQHLHSNLGNAVDPDSFYTWMAYRDAGTGFTGFEVRAGHDSACFHGDCRPGNPRQPQVFGWAPLRAEIPDVPEMYMALPKASKDAGEEVTWSAERSC
jgi:hypothetical protein